VEAEHEKNDPYSVSAMVDRVGHRARRRIRDGAQDGVEIKVEPYRDACSVGTLALGDKVEILQRQGGRFQVKNANAAGWVRMLSVRRGEAPKARIGADGILGLASGRAGAGKVVATTGVRGLPEEDLKQAKFNEAEVKKLESFTVTQAEGQKFAAAGKLVAQKVDYLQASK
jgi:hypothetical protein